MRATTLARLFAAAAPCVASACLADAPSAPAEPTGTVAIALPDFELFEGDTVPLKAVVRHRGGDITPDAPVSWASLDPTVATIDTTGALITLRPGTARVVARSGALADTASLAVRRLTVLEVEIAGVPDLVTPGDILFVDVRAFGQGGRRVLGRNISLTSADAEVAVIDPSGRLRAVAPGRAALSAVVDGVTRGTTVVVNGTATTIPLAFLDGVKIPVLVAADSVVWNGVAELHEVYLESGALELTGAPQPRYRTTLRYREYAVVDDGAGGTTRSPRIGYSETDLGIVDYDPRGDLAMTSELTWPLSHRARVDPEGFAMRYRIPGDDTILELFFRR